MARIRSRHPGIMTDENYVAMSFAARLALEGLGHEADDAGVFEWKPVGLKMRLFPADAVDMAELLAELVGNGWVLRYEIDGKAYGAIRNFCRWQRPKRPSYKLPRSPEVDEWVEFPTLSEHVPPKPESVPTKGGKSPQMEEVVGRLEDVGGNSLPSVESEATQAPPPNRRRGTRLPDDWEPTEADLAFAEQHGWTGSPLETEALKFRNYWTSKAGAAATKLDWHRTFCNWLLTARRPGQGPPAGTSQAQSVAALISEIH